MAAVGTLFRGLGKVVKWLLIIGALIIVIAIIAVVVGLGNAANESEESSEQVTPAKYAQVQNGDSQANVRSLLGDPENTDTTNVKGLGQSDCWYYGVLAKQTTQICFNNADKVNFKAQYGSK
jgi:outer membrane protein assembly factor BamE (lipoprotein component of BamABCDE complex)